MFIFRYLKILLKGIYSISGFPYLYEKLGFELEEGMKINVIGRVQLYEPSGSYSIIIEKAEPDGIGALAIQFEQLKKKLGEEGLFQEKFKQALPQFPRRNRFQQGAHCRFDTRVWR